MLSMVAAAVSGRKCRVDLETIASGYQILGGQMPGPRLTADLLFD